MLKIGIIGGTGFKTPGLLDDVVEKTVKTPFGEPSDSLIVGKIGGVECVLLARHAKGHSIMPSLVNYRANVWAMKQEGCTHLLVTTAVGSLREHIEPGHIVLLDQFIDRTYRRMQTFYDETPGGPTGVCHVPTRTPFCEATRTILSRACEDLGIPYHRTGTAVTVEGPRFSTTAESRMFRLWGADVVNMTVVPEVVLAKEAGLSYAAMALVTDYDTWREESGAEHVNIDVVNKCLLTLAQTAKKLILYAVPRIADVDWTKIVCDNRELVQSSVM